MGAGPAGRVESGGFQDGADLDARVGQVRIRDAANGGRARGG